MIDFDVETSGLQAYSGKHEAFLYIFGDERGSVALPYTHDDQHNHEEIQHWFDRGAQEGIRAWNSKFDFHFAAQAGFTLPPKDKWHDGMLVAHAVDERRSVALKRVSSDLFGESAISTEKEIKAWLTHERARRKKEAAELGEELIEPTYQDIPYELIEPYALEDVNLTRRVCDHYEPIISQSADLQRCIEFENETLGTLFEIERRGLPASEHDYRQLELEVIENLERLEDEAIKLGQQGGVEEFNPRSSQQIIEALKGRNANMDYMSTKDGKISADAENLRAVDDPLAQAILEFRSEDKVLTTYVRPMLGRHYETSMRMWKEPFIAPDGRIHANYRQVGARTGRMSCSDPNIQNQPRDDLRLRYCIRASEGNKLVVCDLSNIEMVLFAAYAGEGKLLRAVREGEDLHALTAKMLGLRDRRRPGGGIETARQLGKTYNFSRIYGGGLRTIRRQFRCNLDEARKLKKRFDEAYPEVQRLTTRIQCRLEDRGYISDTISGRRFRVEERDAYKGANYLIQGTAASVLKRAINALEKDGVPVVGVVHDEVIADVPEADAAEAMDLIVKRLCDQPELTEQVPLHAEGAIVDRWSDAKPMKDGSLFVPNFALREKELA